MLGLTMFRALWAYRGFVWSSVMREFHGKYRESLLGGFWSIANPLTMIIIYTVVLGRLMRPTLAGYENHPFAFPIYLCAGVITWGLFVEVVTRLSTVFQDNGNIIKKSNFPRICLPVIVVLSALLNFAIVMIIYLTFLGIIGHWPGKALIAFIPLLILQLAFATGLGVFLGTLNVFYRDVSQLIGVVLQFWFWLTPIVYTSAALSENIQGLSKYNPMAALMRSYQQVFLERIIPSFSDLWTLLVVAIFFLVLGAWFFLVNVGEMVDEL